MIKIFKWSIYLSLILFFTIVLTLLLSMYSGSRTKEFNLNNYSNYFPGANIYLEQCDLVVRHEYYYESKSDKLPNMSCYIEYIDNSVKSISLTVTNDLVITNTVLNLDSKHVQFDDICGECYGLISYPGKSYFKVFKRNLFHAILKYMSHPSNAYNWKRYIIFSNSYRAYVINIGSMTLFTGWKNGEDRFGIEQIVLRKSA